MTKYKAYVSSEARGFNPQPDFDGDVLVTIKETHDEATAEATAEFYVIEYPDDHVYVYFENDDGSTGFLTPLEHSPEPYEWTFEDVVDTGLIITKRNGSHVTGKDRIETYNLRAKQNVRYFHTRTNEIISEYENTWGHDCEHEQDIFELKPGEYTVDDGDFTYTIYITEGEK